MRCFQVAASVVLLAGSTMALAQPVVDGSKDALYGPAKWLQTQPTSFGDNRADLCVSIGSKVAFAINNNNDDGLGGPGGVGPGILVFDNSPTSTDPHYLAALAVTTGFEFRIPFSQLGNPVGDIRLAGFINNNGGNYLSNQAIGGFAFAPGATRDNLGGNLTGGYDGTCNGDDLGNTTQAPGNQYITITNTAGIPCGTVPLIDGTRDAFYGPPLWVQNVQTNFNGGTYHDPNYNDRSEIDAVYAKVCRADVGDGLQDYLFLFVAGNVQTGNNYSNNRLQLFFDSGVAGGQNQLSGTLPPAGGLGGSIGLKFDAGFSANYFMSIVAGYNESLNGYRVQASYAKLGTGAAGGIIGAGGSTTEIVGTGTLCPPDVGFAIGSELDGLYSYVDRTNNRLNLLFTGNLKEGDFLTLFFDVNGNPTGDEGQNTLNGPNSPMLMQRKNVNIGTEGIDGSLNRLGYSSATNPGLTFDAGFFADYFLNTHVEAGTRHVIDCAVLRTGGRSENLFNGTVLDYGSYHGFDIPTLLTFDGTNFNNAFEGGLQPQADGGGNIFSHYPPRESNRVLLGYLANHANVYPPMIMDGTHPAWTDWLGVTTIDLVNNPVAPLALRPRSGLIRGRIDNSNVLGVVGISDPPGGDASTAITGFELSINLEELGYNPRSRIRVAGFLNRGGFDVVGNQVLGVSTGAADLGEPNLINFATFAGKQYVVVASCVADFDGSGNVSVADIFAFLGAWFAQTGQIGPGHTADFDNNNVVNVADIFAYLGAWFQGNCIGGD